MLLGCTRCEIENQSVGSFADFYKSQYVQPIDIVSIWLLASLSGVLCGLCSASSIVVASQDYTLLYHNYCSILVVDADGTSTDEVETAVQSTLDENTFRKQG
ncbi:unnamed protein product [Protopolystoma xenopodis]|uniref:Uncharacterized protein n=1 Tax=Protopolystoma xenopodis TaxID=117903 RepID=A0A3S5AX47_9PLAT|nr:unnamed protein product [Protopolystoma xenopodis]